MLRRAVSVTLVIVCSLPPAVQALSTDRAQPIHVQADFVKVDKKSGLSLYQGHVRLTQGSLEITGDELTIRQPEGQLKEIIVLGQPATFKQDPDDPKQGPVRSRAHRMEYYADNERVILLKEAFVQQGSQQFSGDRIVYSTRSSTVTAEGDETGKTRVHAIIVPKEKQQQAEEKKAP